MNLTSNSQIELITSSLRDTNKHLRQSKVSPQKNLPAPLRLTARNKYIRITKTKKRTTRIAKSLRNLASVKKSLGLKRFETWIKWLILDRTVRKRIRAKHKTSSQVIKPRETSVKNSIKRKKRVKGKKGKAGLLKAPISRVQSLKTKDKMHKTSDTFPTKLGLWADSTRPADQIRAKYPRTLKDKKIYKRISKDEIIASVVRRSRGPMSGQTNSHMIKISTRTKKKNWYFYKLKQQAARQYRPIFAKARSFSRPLSPEFNPMKLQKKWFRRYSYNSHSLYTEKKLRTTFAVASLARSILTKPGTELHKLISRYSPLLRMPPKGFNETLTKKSYRSRNQLLRIRQIFKSKTKEVKPVEVLPKIEKKPEKKKLSQRDRKKAKKRGLTKEEYFKLFIKPLSQPSQPSKPLSQTKLRAQKKKNRLQRRAERMHVVKSTKLLLRILLPQNKHLSESAKNLKELRPVYELARSSYTQHRNTKVPFVGIPVRLQLRSLIKHVMKLSRVSLESGTKTTPWNSRARIWRNRRNTNDLRAKVRPHHTNVSRYRTHGFGVNQALPRFSIKSSRYRKWSPWKHEFPRGSIAVERRWYNKNRRHAEDRRRRRVRFKRFKTRKLTRIRRIKTPLLSRKNWIKLSTLKFKKKPETPKTGLAKKARLTRSLSVSGPKASLKLVKSSKSKTTFAKMHFTVNSSLIPLVTNKFSGFKSELTPLVRQTLTSNHLFTSSAYSRLDLNYISEYVREARRQKEAITGLEPSHTYPTRELEILFMRNLSYLASGQTTLPHKEASYLKVIDQQVADTPDNRDTEFTKCDSRHDSANPSNLKEIRALLSNWASDRHSLIMNANLPKIEKEYSLVFLGQQNKGRTSNVGADFSPTNLYTRESWSLTPGRYLSLSLPSADCLAQSLRSLLKRRLKKSRFAPKGITKVPTNPQVFQTQSCWQLQPLDINEQLQSLYMSKLKNTQHRLERLSASTRTTGSFVHLRRLIMQNIHSSPVQLKKRKYFTHKSSRFFYKKGSLTVKTYDPKMQRSKNTNSKTDEYSYRNRVLRSQKYFVLMRRIPLRRKSAFLRKHKKRRKVGRLEIRRLKKPLLKRKWQFRKDITFLRHLKNKVQRSSLRPQPNLNLYRNIGHTEICNRTWNRQSNKIISTIQSSPVITHRSRDQLLDSPKHQPLGSSLNYLNSPYVTLSPNAAISILSSPLLLKIQYGPTAINLTTNKMNQMLNRNLSLFDSAPSPWNANTSNTKLKHTNLIPHSCFRYTISKKLASFLAHKSFRHNVLPLFHNTLIRFMEHVTGTKCAVQLYPFVNQHVSKEAVTRYQLWIPRMSFYERKLGHRFFLEEALHIMHLSFVLRDASIVAYWLRSMILRISFWKTRSIFRFLRYLLLNYYRFVFDDLQIKGMKIKLKGKISAAGNSRKRTILFRTGRTSHSSVNSRVSYKSLLVNTFTGVMGFQLWLFY